MEPTPKRTVILSCLPSGSSVTFQESSFFSRNEPNVTLPTLAEVLAASAIQDPSSCEHPGLPPVLFESLGLVVKCGREDTVSISEGQCLWALRHLLPEIPVPEIYGWAEEGGYTMLYMELIHGDTVEKRWDLMSTEERHRFWGSLQSMYKTLRTLGPDPDNTFLGNYSTIHVH